MERVLEFDVSKQNISRNVGCSFDGIVSGTQGYLKAKFNFSKEWNNCAKVAVFRMLLDEYPVPLSNTMCEIPSEVTKWDEFFVRVVGRDDKGTMVTTNEVSVKQIKRSVK